jgi:hypothetical protein
MRRWMGLLVATLVLAACGSGSTAGTSPSGSATPSPSLSPNTLIVIADFSQSAYGTTPTVLHLVRPDGTEVNQLTLKAGATTTTARGSRIFVVEQDGSLKALHRDGSVEDLGSLGTTLLDGSVVASSDGNTWVWGTTSSGSHGTVFAGAKGAAPRVLEQSDETGRAVRPYSWTQRGLTIEHGGLGIGGYILFYTATGPIDLVDPVTGTITPINHTSDCSFSDLATSGTIACFPQATMHTLSLIAQGGKVTTVALAADRFAREGAAYFSPNGDQVAVGGATGSGPGKELFATDLVNTGDGTIKPLGLDGVRPADGPWAWLSDGSLIVYRPQVAAAGTGVWLVGPTGTVTKLAAGGLPIGVLSG